MSPFGSFTYFGVLLYPTLLTLGLGLLGRATWRWLLLATAAMLLVQYWGVAGPGASPVVREIWQVAAFGALQWAVASGFLRVRARGKSRAAFYSAVGLSLAPLLAAKLLPVLAVSTTVGFLGISYVTFRSLDTILGIQDGLIKALSPLRYLAFLFFFPTISSGPIDRYKRFVADFDRERTRGEFLADLDAGVQRFFTGLLYKFVIAALIKQYWLDPAAAQAGVLGLASYMYAYSLYLFFDFAGYSAFAIGVSYLFGIRTPENFNKPFLASNIADFWNRWHMTLSYWFRDHVYMRFVMTATRKKWFADKLVASSLGFLVSFGLMGLWHGLAAHYILYGLYHAALLAGHQHLTRWGKRRWPGWGEGRLWAAGSVVLTFNLVCFGFLLFSGRLG
jgi:membrane protein involved in D-alanine export